MVKVWGIVYTFGYCMGMLWVCNNGMGILRSGMGMVRYCGIGLVYYWYGMVYCKLLSRVSMLLLGYGSHF